MENPAKKSPGRGCGHMEEPSSPTPSSPSPCDGDDAASSASQASSVASLALSVVDTYSQPSVAKKKRAKKTPFSLDVEEEQLMCNFLRENVILWDRKKTDYRRVDKKAKLWEDQAKAMGKTVKHLQGWFTSLRNIHTCLDRKRGDSSRVLTEREQWVKANFGFLNTVVRHRAARVNSVKATIAAHSRDPEAACANIVVDDDSTHSSVPSSSSQRKGKRGQDDDQLLQSLQKTLRESGELIKGLTQPQPITATTAFANYVRDSLVSMSKRKFRKARSHINTILTELMDEESDEEESPRVPTFPAPASVQPSSAPATYTSTTALEMCQPPPHMWRHMAPAASVWGSQTADYVDHYMQQMTPHPLQHEFQSPPQIKQQPSPSALDTSSQSPCNMSGLSGSLNMSSDPDAASSPYGLLKTPPPPDKN